MPEIKIKLKECSYSVYAGFRLEKISGKMMHPSLGNKVLILSDRNVFPLYGKIVRESIRSAGKEVSEMVLPAGEKTKNFNQLLRIIEAFCSNKMSRDDTVITLGGGVISDIGGFASSIYMRGINFAAVPTTLLAQVDAAIGGKTAVNLPFGKNLAGTFYQPSFVYVDFAALD
ncbi:MAG TPA: 3-dehydroquinate synthase family protein, partial [bacterium]|nr:3-dehydroquinate synthase family protein [bacterium]